MRITDFDISSIIVESRQERPLNLDGLIASIQDVGLLHPIVVGADGRLKVGYRRLKAYERMGRATIPAHVTDNLDDVYAALKAERDENIQREDLPMSLLVERAAELDAEERRLAAERRRATQLQGRDERGEPIFGSGKLPEPKEDAGDSRDRVAEAFGISGSTYEKAKKVVAAAEADPGTFGDLPELMDATNVSKALRELVKRERKEIPPLPTDKYRVIYADPPWAYGNSGIINDDNYGHAVRHYPSMTIEELCAMGDDIKATTEQDAVLFLWVTSPLLEECFPVIKAWGFKYKTSFVWDKVRHNFGHYNSVRHELLLVCTRGSCTPDATELFDSVQSIEKSRTHSEKPEEFRTIIDTLYPHGKRLELFSRTQAEGWEVWGNEPGQYTTC